jgi:hypothetical protein
MKISSRNKILTSSFFALLVGCQGGESNPASSSKAGGSLTIPTEFSSLSSSNLSQTLTTQGGGLSEAQQIALDQGISGLKDFSDLQSNLERLASQQGADVSPVNEIDEPEKINEGIRQGISQAIPPLQAKLPNEVQKIHELNFHIGKSDNSPLQCGGGTRSIDCAAGAISSVGSSTAALKQDAIGTITHDISERINENDCSNIEFEDLSGSALSFKAINNVKYFQISLSEGRGKTGNWLKRPPMLPGEQTEISLNLPENERTNDSVMSDGVWGAYPNGRKRFVVSQSTRTVPDVLPTTWTAPLSLQVSPDGQKKIYGFVHKRTGKVDKIEVGSAVYPFDFL